MGGGGGSMTENILRAMAALDRFLRFAPSHLAVILFEADVPSAVWQWIWSVLAELRIPEWASQVLQPLYVPAPLPAFLQARVVEEASLDTARGIEQGCPNSGSVWALFGPAVRLLLERMSGPPPTSFRFADDMATTLAEVLAHLPALLRVCDALRIAAGLALNFSNALIVNYGVRPDFVLTRRLMDAMGVARMIVARSGV